jgi:hypothetical protein
VWGTWVSLMDLDPLWGLPAIAVGLAVAVYTPKRDGSRWPEAAGSIAGPGLICLLASMNGPSHPERWLTAGALFVGAATAVYVVSLLARRYAGHA